MATRKAEVDGSDGITFTVTCSDCPLKKHTDALGLKPNTCASGIQTNMQGAVVLQRCQHLGEGQIDPSAIICNNES